MGRFFWTAIGLGVLGWLIAGGASGADLQEGLVAYWPFDEGKGRIAADASGNGHDGEFVGEPLWVPGYFGTALEFTTPADYVRVPDHPALDLEEAVTWMAWFSPSDVLTSRRMMVKNNSIFVIFDFGDPNSVDFLIKPNNDFAESTTTEWTIGEWYHFAGTFDGAFLRVYVNGVLEGETPYAGLIAPSDLELWIGADDFGRPTDSFPGKIDEVRLYNRALSAEEIAAAMETALAVEPRGKLATQWAQLKTAHQP
ncbi:MAG: hypothetical protein KatS3mg115_1191 [Candidatus Poribacteria bacterium]|nr:MAG: hypothetical protein KatS3mg115_1191 [Candidatus Poribacteria bacterium]